MTEIGIILQFPSCIQFSIFYLIYNFLTLILKSEDREMSYLSLSFEITEIDSKQFRKKNVNLNMVCSFNMSDSLIVKVP